MKKLFDRPFNKPLQPKTDIKKLPYFCEVLSKALGKEGKELVLVEVERISRSSAHMQKYEPWRDTFVDCNSIDKCGLQTKNEQGETLFDRDQCPACIKIKIKGTL